MATLNSPQYAGKLQSAGIGDFGDLKFVWATYAFTTTANVANDIINLVYLPKNSLLVAASVDLDPVDSNGSRTFDLTIGNAAAGASTDTYTSPAGIVYTNAFSSLSATLIGDTGVIGATASTYRFPLTTGPLFASSKTLLTANVKAIQATAVAGSGYFKFEYFLL